MDGSLIWKALLIFLAGTVLLRVGGRKSISQMTMPQTIIMISLGTLLVTPIADKGIGTTIVIGSILVLSLIFTEWVQMRSNRMESVITGKSVPVIENGHLVEKNLSGLRLTVDHLEMRLREAGISSIQDVQTATIEANGLLGYELKPEKQPATKEDIQRLAELLQSGQFAVNPEKNNIFTEVTGGEQGSNHPKYLQ